MKGTFSILFFFLCSLFSSLDAQTTRNDSVEVIIVFPENALSGVIETLRTRIGATQVDKIRIFNAYLWRMRKGQEVNTNSPAMTIAINNTSDMIGVISNGAQELRIIPRAGSPNYNTIVKDSIRQLTVLFDSTVHNLLNENVVKRMAVLPDPYIQICGTNRVNIFVLDSGNKGGSNGTGKAFIDSYLNPTKAKCFITGSNNPVDNSGHGTAVISVIATAFNDLKSNGITIPSNSITSVKVLDDTGKGKYWQYLQGFAYALENGAQVINSSVIIKDTTAIGAITPIDIAMSYAQSRHIMVVTGAGNDATRITNTTAIGNPPRTPRFLPADISNNNLITVAASTSLNTLTALSNYGQTGSLMAARGEEINAMGLNLNVVRGTGTSFSTPFVTATYAVLKYMSPTSDETLLKNIILKTTRDKSNFGSKPTDFGILNMFSACQLLNDTLCPPPSTPSVSSLNSNAAVIGWTPMNFANGYVVQYKRATDTVWITATGVNSTNLAVSLTGLVANTMYVVRVRSNCSDFESASCIINYSPELRFTTLKVPTCIVSNTPSVLSAGITSTGATVTWTAVAGAQSYILEYKAATPITATWTRITGITATSRILSGLLSNTAYNVRIKTVCSATASSGTSIAANFTTSSLSCTDVYESNETMATAKVMLGTVITAKITTATDVDWFRIKAFNNGLVKVTLSDLPANYDLFLYDAAGILKASSRQIGKVSETLEYTTAIGTSLAANFFIKVVGVSGAFNANNCYTLRVQTPDIFDAGYFQLRGQSSGSGIINTPISSTADFNMTVFPNPITTDQFSVNINSDGIGQGYLTIFDSMGRIVYQNPDLSLEKGQTIQSIDFSKQNNGLYMVQIIKDKVIKTHKIFLSR